MWGRDHFADMPDGAILNPGGLTQHGVSLHDAIKDWKKSGAF